MQANKAEFPTLFVIAVDYLPIQALSVPCKHVFSSSNETDTKKRNHIKPELMETLQMLKFAYKKERLNFMGRHMITKKEMSMPQGKLDARE